jgi:hypothetical protein
MHGERAGALAVRAAPSRLVGQWLPAPLRARRRTRTAHARRAHCTHTCTFPEGYALGDRIYRRATGSAAGRLANGSACCRPAAGPACLCARRLTRSSQAHTARTHTQRTHAQRTCAHTQRTHTQRARTHTHSARTHSAHAHTEHPRTRAQRTHDTPAVSQHAKLQMAVDWICPRPAT